MDDLYDEFGNFIGEAEESEDDSQHGIDAGAYVYDEYPEEAPETTGQELMEIDGTWKKPGPFALLTSRFIDEGPSNAVVLHEDKQYYPTAQQVYGEDVETMVQEEDAQPLSVPIIAPVEQKKFTIQEADLPPVHFDRSFMMDLMNFPDQIRNIAFAGHLHHGKTALMDMLVLETHDIAHRLEKRTGRKRDEQLRYTDVHMQERERGLSIKSAPMSLVLPSTHGKSHLVNILDTPGHVNFVDEVASSLRLVDGVVLVVDVVEGVQVNTEQIIKHAVLEGLPLTLVVNKMDRLILELKLPPSDAYFKLKHVVEEVNTVIENVLPGQGEKRRLSPEKGNVLFASSIMGWCFTLQSFAKMYAESYPPTKKGTPGINAQEFARRLWGDVFFNPRKRSFTRKGIEEQSKRAFVHFVLEPIYKLYSHTISESPEDLKETLATLGITLKPSQFKTDAKVLLKLVCEQFFGPSNGFVDMVVEHIPSPVDSAKAKLERYYTGPLDTSVAKAIENCDQDGPLIVQISKLFNTSDATGFNSFGRVMSGTARLGTQVRVLGEGYSIDDEEDMSLATISDVWIAESRYNIPTDGVPAGNWVLLGGVDNSIVKSATLVPTVLPDEEDAYIFKPITHFTESVFKVAVEPINPSELPKMLDGLRKINKSYPLITTKVEESGEHVILGTGELYMDCVLHDLRRLYAEMEIKVSDAVTRFCETVVETSAMKCYAQTPNKKNKITMVAEPLDQGIAEDIESGKVSIKSPNRTIGKFFEDRYGWDLLASRSIWAFGPDDLGPNILQNDTLPTEVDKHLLMSVRDTIRQGFSWATREGPLCEEHFHIVDTRTKSVPLSSHWLIPVRMLTILVAIRNTKFKLMDVTLAPEAIFRGGGQIIPTSRRACYSSFLMASPRLMEPVYSCSMTGPADSVTTLYTVLAKRRGHVLSDGPIAGTPLYRVSGLIPVIDSFGFETDLRIHTQGQATLSLVFDRWSIVPGDPLDKDVILRPLEPASAQATARDFVLKTRRRKGLSEDVSVAKFLEPELFSSLKVSGLLDGL
ncbi:116 kDa U5 small nuclear ribonucleoprotein component [Lachnellula occidentalis]|uniref:116 kDa U5 small nuclear ribonucleoprotein component n=1 Tax=Lachnellula occidentalis TaxID=215460 RepID=A0A8H8U944_9HELO|nr:116 kDa U5 small nuclear ribonucleoprotein component [Lachnellula occidentalis]